MTDAYLVALFVVGGLLIAAGVMAVNRLLARLRLTQQDLRVALGELERNAERLEFLAHHDFLTALPNRAMFEDRARQAVAHATRRSRTLALLFLDLDRFKEVNDTHGHDVGDALLRAVAGRLRGVVRGEDMVARLGGDEFCVLLQEIGDPREAAAVAQKILHELGQPYHLPQGRLETGASIGIACLPQDGEDAATLLKLADEAMYRAKGRGRGGFQYYSSSLGFEAASASVLADELRKALAGGQIELHYQPRIDLARQQAAGAEVQLHWRHPVRGLLGPEDFLRLADESGEILKLGDWALRNGCDQLRRWIDGGHAHAALAFSLSPRQLRHSGLRDEVKSALDASNVPAARLLLEVPEHALRLPAPGLQETLQALSGLGVRLGVDDFGTGYAALPALQRLRIETVCIDRRLVASVPEHLEDAALVRAIAALARSLGIEVAAKGVDTAAQRDFLAEAGCRYGQGELLGAARPADAIEPVLEARRAA